MDQHIGRYNLVAGGRAESSQDVQLIGFWYHLTTFMQDLPSLRGPALVHPYLVGISITAAAAGCAVTKTVAGEVWSEVCRASRVSGDGTIHPPNSDKVRGYFTYTGINIIRICTSTRRDRSIDRPASRVAWGAGRPTSLMWSSMQG